MEEGLWNPTLEIIRKRISKVQAKGIIEDILPKGLKASSFKERDVHEFLFTLKGEELLADVKVRRALVLGLEKLERVELVRRLRPNEDLRGIQEDKLVKLAIVDKWQPGRPMPTIFCQLFGFDLSLAGELVERVKKSDVEDVLALAKWNGPHDYQDILIEKLQEWFYGTKNDTGILVLPTGTGKTCVAGMLIVKYFETIRKGGGQTGTVLWIAHTAELLEQAFQSISRLWSMEGLEGSYLRMARFWEDKSEGLLIEKSDLVIAGIQKLHKAIHDEGAATIIKNHLKPRINLVVMDEAHLADNPSYLEVLNFLSDEEFGPDGGNGWKLLGLTATPFKSEEKRTKKLRSMFKEEFSITDGDRLKGIDKLRPWKWFQTNGYLSKHIEYQSISLDVAETYDFDPAEKRYYRQYKNIRSSVLAKLALSDYRNKRIIDKLIDNINNEISRKVLLFACSVAHCQILSQELFGVGIKNYSVIGTMSSSLRNMSVQGFKDTHDGPVVMINYGILTTGFDDPKIDTVFITRPTSSGVLYHQMIGRGLRGVKNGGNSDGRCTIMDVKDNFISFSGLEIIRYDEGLWREN